MIGSVGNVLWVVMGTIGLVMLIACTNVANLLLVRADGRQQELAVRTALGAGRGRIAWELLLESVALGLIGGVLGIAIAYEGLRLLVAIGPAIFLAWAKSPWMADRCGSRWGFRSFPAWYSDRFRF